MNTPPYASLLADRGVALLERLGGRTFRLRGPAPAWLRELLGDAPVPEAFDNLGALLPFLDHFLEDAEQFWSHPEGPELCSSLWTETLANGSDLHLEASACQPEGRDYLLIRRVTARFDELHRVFQRGRELSLTHERLLAEIVKKEVLLHCIIHDISGPLQGMMGALELARAEARSPAITRILNLGLISAAQQQNLINDLLDTFRAETACLEKAEIDPAAAPDVVACAMGVVHSLQPAFAVRRLAARVVLPLDDLPIHVFAEQSRLERVFHNLLQNAQRHSPPAGQVTVTFQREEGFVRVGVEDRGSGVAEELIPQLFQKFVRRGARGGKAGLGLFFCRITVEGWGGAIGCEPRAGGGATFWFRLRTAVRAG